jgi:hypothetical protein
MPWLDKASPVCRANGEQFSRIITDASTSQAPGNKISPQFSMSCFKIEWAHSPICSVTRYTGIYPSGHQVPCARYSGDDAGVDNVRLR